MDASTAVATLHRIDPAFRDICDALYPGLEPRQVADQVYGVSKGNPDQADVHVPTTQWRNGRGHTKGRGRRKIDDAVKETKFVGKRQPPVVSKTAPKKDHSRAARNVGLATTAVGTGISAVSLPKHLKELPAAMKNAKTGPSAREGIKQSVRAVRTFSKPPAGGVGPVAESNALKTGMGAVRAGARVARENPRLSAALLVGATALHTANLAGEGIATHVLHSGGKKNPAIQGTSLTKAWDEAQARIVKAFDEGLITKAEALDLGQVVYADLSKGVSLRNAALGVGLGAAAATPMVASVARLKHGTRNRAPRNPGVIKAAYGSMGGSMTSGNIKLQSLKAPPPVKLDGPRLSATKVGVPTPAKSGAGSSGRTSNKKAVKKSSVETDDVIRSLDIVGEISKLNEDKQQCFGWCSVVKVDGKDVIDKQNDMIDIDDIEVAAYDYMLTSRKGGDMHRRSEDGGPHHAADCIESFVLTPEKIEKMGLPEGTQQGWWIGMQVNDEDLWQDVRSGRKTKFSIHGSGRRTEVLVND